jgi:DNA-binding transcriptional LysR family regulator
MPELDDIRAFVEVAETGGFSRAARRLGVSKSIVSRRLARLEADLGAQLLSRTTRGVSATEAGTEYKARAERILADLDEAHEAVAQQSGDVVGRLRLSVPLSFGTTHLAPVLAELALRHRHLAIEAAYSDRFVDLIAERFDAAIRLGTLKDSSLVARRIAAIRGIVVASPAYLARAGRPQVPDDLTGHACLLYADAANGVQWRFRAGRRWVSVRPEGRFRADNGEALMHAAIAGLGIAVLPTFLAAAAIERGAVEPLLQDYPLPEGGLYVVRPPGAQVPGKLRVLIDLLLERFGGEPYWDACQMRARREAADASHNVEAAGPRARRA